MHNYVLDPVVEDELWEIWQFVARDNPAAATGLVEAAFKTFEMLAANPALGRPRSFQNPRLRGIRSWRIVGYENYLIFYRPIQKGVRVHHVYHGARDLESLFRKA
ncbi:MAG TPA: type II toxin-antitoxin system RelE/ParE family toxin [Verrucomicrobiae bacterium]|nr:type II toxin-antitoxin system RelE/ParE family toxin [Verrucomicrobiae bacterium]